MSIEYIFFFLQLTFYMKGKKDIENIHIVKFYNLIMYTYIINDKNNY